MVALPTCSVVAGPETVLEARHGGFGGGRVKAVSSLCFGGMEWLVVATNSVKTFMCSPLWIWRKANVGVTVTAQAEQGKEIPMRLSKSLNLVSSLLVVGNGLAAGLVRGGVWIWIVGLLRGSDAVSGLGARRLGRKRWRLLAVNRGG